MSLGSSIDRTCFHSLAVVHQPARMNASMFRKPVPPGRSSTRSLEFFSQPATLPVAFTRMMNLSTRLRRSAFGLLGCALLLGATLPAARAQDSGSHSAAGDPIEQRSDAELIAQDASAASQEQSSESGSNRFDAATARLTGYGESYWGYIPPPADSISAPFRNTPRPLWEYPLLVPYRIAELPIRATWNVAGATYGLLERHHVIQTLSRLLGPKDLPYGFTMQLKAGGLTGVGGGVGFFHNSFLGEDNRFKARALYTSTGTRRAVAGVLIGVGRPFYLDAGVGYTLRQNARYFGLGHASDPDDESFYSQESGWAGLSLGRRFPEHFVLELTGAYSQVGTRAPHEERTPPIAEQFAADLPFGYGDRSKGVLFDLTFFHDNTSETGRPERGGVRRVELSHFLESGAEEGGDSPSYWGYRANLEQFVPLWFTERALALRGFVGYLDGQTDEIPFQRLYTNDEPDQLRGYTDYRWRDRGIAAATIEYRWPAWSLRALGGLGIDAYLLTDLGQVFHDFDEISSRNATVSYGGGLRLASPAGFRGRIEIARSEEETVFRISTDQIFQYDKGDLYNGRDSAVLR